jgi:hypothetical protein
LLRRDLTSDGTLTTRHCEQSEAIQNYRRGSRLDCFVAIAPRNDEPIPRESYHMKLTFSPASPFARKVRIAAIELGLDAFYQKMLERPSVKVSVPPAG